MFEKWRIKEHMEIADAAGQHVGTVDEVDGDRIKLTRSDSGDGAHHYLDISDVDKIDDNRVYLKSGTALPGAQSVRSESYAGTVSADNARPGVPSSGMSPSTSDVTDYSPSTERPRSDTPLFGTSGQGTGFGGSGAGN